MGMMRGIAKVRRTVVRKEAGVGLFSINYTKNEMGWPTARFCEIFALFGYMSERNFIVLARTFPDLFHKRLKTNNEWLPPQCDTEAPFFQPENHSSYRNIIRKRKC